MLVLSRKVREQICLPGLDVVLTVLEVRGGKVRWGSTLPMTFPCTGKSYADDHESTLRTTGASRRMPS